MLKPKTAPLPVPTPLLTTDLVVQCTNDLICFLKFLPTKYLLTNGKVEKPLKYFIGAAWEAKNSQNAYVMDKVFNYRELDLLAFQKANPVFWIEAKCSFIDDYNDMEKSAIKAIQQVTSNIEHLPDCFELCAGYIVHFTLSLIPVNDPLLPKCVQDKFRGLRGNKNNSVPPPNHLDIFDNFYKKPIGNYYQGHAIIEICASPLTYALIIRVC